MGSFLHTDATDFGEFHVSSAELLASENVRVDPQISTWRNKRLPGRGTRRR